MVIFSLDDHQVFTLLRALDGLDDGGGAVASVIRTQANLCEECDRPRDDAGHCPVCDKDNCTCDDDAGFAADRDDDGPALCDHCAIAVAEVFGHESNRHLCRACSPGVEERAERERERCEEEDGDDDGDQDDGQPDSRQEHRDFAGDDEPGGYGDCDDGF